MTASAHHFSNDNAETGRPVRILLVEDDPADVRLTREMLRESKVRNDLLVAQTAEEAEEDVIKSYDEHANVFVTKLVDLDEITTIVQSIDEFRFQVVRLTPE